MKTPQSMKHSLRLVLYVIVALFATSTLLFGAQGLRYVTNFLGSGISFIDQYSTSGTGADLGIATASLYASRNGTWFPWPATNSNYIRGTTFLSGTLYDEQNTAYYVDPASSSTLNQLIVTGSITGPTPTADGDLATKGYVDAASAAGGGGGYNSCYRKRTSTPSYPTCDTGFTRIFGVYANGTGTSSDASIHEYAIYFENNVAGLDLRELGEVYLYAKSPGYAIYDNNNYLLTSGAGNIYCGNTIGDKNVGYTQLDSFVSTIFIYPEGTNSGSTRGGYAGNGGGLVYRCAPYDSSWNNNWGYDEFGFAVCCN